MILKKAKGINLYLYSNKRIFDLSCGYAGNIFGYSNKTFTKILKNNINLFNIYYGTNRSDKKYLRIFDSLSKDFENYNIYFIKPEYFYLLNIINGNKLYFEDIEYDINLLSINTTENVKKEYNVYSDWYLLFNNKVTPKENDILLMYNLYFNKINYDFNYIVWSNNFPFGYNLFKILFVKKNIKNNIFDLTDMDMFYSNKFGLELMKKGILYYNLLNKKRNYNKIYNYLKLKLDLLKNKSIIRDYLGTDLSYRIQLVDEKKQVDFLNQYFNFVYKESYLYLLLPYLIDKNFIDYLYKKFKSSLCRKNL